MYDESEIDWSETSYTLKDLIKSFTLPQLVMVDEGYMLNETESLSSGQLITVQSHENVTQFKGVDSEGKDVTLPVKCPFKVKLVAKEEDKLYKGVGDLCKTLERPKYVEVKSSKAKRDLGLVKSGDRLKILLTERGPNGPTYLHFRNQRGKHLRLPVDFGCEFRGCAEDDNEHLLADLICKEFPLYIKFIDSQAIGDSIGIIELNDCIHDTLVFASTKHQGRLFATAFPLSLDVKVRTMQDSRQTKLSGEKIYESAMSTIDVDKFREFMNRDKTIHESGYVYFAPIDAVKDKDETAAVSTEKANGSEITPAVVNEYETPVNSVNDASRKHKGFLSRVRLKFRSNKSTSRKEKPRPEIIIIDRQSGTSSDGGDSGIYEQIPSDTYVSMDIIDGVRRTLKGKPVARKRSLTRAQSSGVPPPLPGNHPLERRHTYNAKSRSALQQRMSASSTKESSLERDNFKKFYDTLKKSETEILSCDLDGVGRILRDLKMEKHAKKFVDNQIDGKLLVDLDEAVFKDIGLTAFEARKLRKYVFGWRPDTAKPDVNYSSNFAENSEALKWSENEVGEHLSNLGLHDFRRFCEQNQVNGDLLWDMVVDEEIIYGLLTGTDRRLNAVKLKNYVTEGWRPKLSKKRANSVNSGTMEKKAGKTKSVAEKNTKLQNSSSSLTKKNSTTLTKKPSISSQSDVMSHESSNSERLVSSGLERSITRPKSRLQAKVTYPKNSPYGKSGAASKPETKTTRTDSINEDKSSGSKEWNDPSSSSENRSASASVGNNKSARPNLGAQSRKEPVINRKSSQSMSRAVTAKKTVKQTGAVPDLPKERDISTKQEKPQRSFSLRAAKMSKSAAKNETVAEKQNIKTESRKTAGVGKAELSSGKEKIKLASSEKAKGKSASLGLERKPRSDGNNARGLEQKEDSSPKCDSEAGHSPSIASLRKQYERNEEGDFKAGEKLTRTGKNELRMAIKRKDSNPRQETKIDDKVRPVTSVARLKKQFDAKPIL